MTHLAVFQSSKDWHSAKDDGIIKLGSTLEAHGFQHIDNAFTMLQRQPKKHWRS
jgi:hypothetical protein